MITLVNTLANAEQITAWLERSIRPHLRTDVSSYARGRLRAWLGKEPTLTSPTRLLPGTPVDTRILHRLEELIGWRFDYCLATYSGDQNATGISPHRDASFADFEAYGLHLSGECRFDYWEARDANANKPASTSLFLQPGQLLRFNCKHLHAATPGLQRWNLNFWRTKP